MSSEDLLAKFDEIVAKRFNEIIEGEQAKMKAEVEANNAEKQRMNAVAVKDNDVIHLNVGGQKLSTTRSTLCQVEGSFLAVMFSGQWDSSHKRDDDGAVFFDYNPQYFIVILNYLRAKKFATPENPASFRKLPEDQVKDFKNFVEYLGLSDEIFPPEKFNVHSSGVTLEEGGKVAVNGPDTAFRYVLGENVYQQGIVRFKLQLESFKDNNWMFVGIVKGDVVSPDSNVASSVRWQGSYGWAVGEHGEEWKDGSGTTESTLSDLTREGDMVELVLDCDAAKLSLYLLTSQQFHIAIPKSQTWRLNVNLHDANDKVRIIHDNV